MKSNLNKTEFKRRLTELTSKEKDSFIITSYNSAGTPFCGTFDDSTFDLTRNSFWRHVKGIEIKGEYRQLDNDSTEVIYKVGPSKFIRNFSKVFFCIVLIATNIFMATWDKADLSTILTINGLLGFAILWASALTWLTKKIIDQRFKEEFEIGIEDEWEKLAGSNV